MRHLLKSTAALLAAAVMLAACGRDLDSNTVNSSNTAGKVAFGKIISARPVTIKDNPKLQDNTAGALAGGAAGGVAASTIGKGKGSDIAAIGGVIAGAVLGAYAEDALTTQNGYEYIVKLEGDPSKKPVTKHREVRVSHDSVKDDIDNSVQTASVTTNVISVDQADDKMIAKGTRVMVIYSDDRTRVVPAD